MSISDASLDARGGSARDTLSRFDPQKIDAIFAPLDQCQEPGAAVAIAIGGHPVYRKGFGLANRELPVLLGPGMRMRIGSTTKHFTCLAYMLLCEDGLASIDDPIQKHIPEINPAAHGITLRQLMGHTTGLPDMLSLSMSVHGTSPAITDRDLLRYYETIDRLEFAPGTAWQYNNGGYILLTAAIERISGCPLDDLLHSRIFRPLGMNDTMLRRWENSFVPNSATLHMVDPQGRFTRDYFGMEITGEGGLVSTMDDMLVWLKHMDAPTIGSSETWRLMTEPHHLSNGCSTGYGLGLVTTTYRGVGIVFHAGGVMGGNSQMIKVPSAGLDISVAVNREDVWAKDLANQIIDLLVCGPENEPRQKGREKIRAVYLSPASGRVVELSIGGDEQLLSIDGAPDLVVRPDQDGVLHFTNRPHFKPISFTPDGPRGCLMEFGNADRMKRVEIDRSAEISSHAGRYRCGMIDTVAEVNGTALVLSGRHGSSHYSLESIASRIWRAHHDGVWPALSGIVVFDEDGAGMKFAADCIRRLRFVRIN